MLGGGTGQGRAGRGEGVVGGGWRGRGGRDETNGEKPSRVEWARQSSRRVSVLFASNR